MSTAAPLPRRPFQPNPTHINRPPLAHMAGGKAAPVTLPAGTPRDEALRSLLLQHREHRALIQATPSSTDLATKLSAALDQVSRLERDFQAFRTTAGRQLAQANDENRRLRMQLATESKQRHMKPSERMLSVDEIRGAKKRNDARHVHRAVRSVRPLRGVDPAMRQPDREDTAIDARDGKKRFSLRPSKKADVIGHRVDRALDADERDLAQTLEGGRRSKRSSLLPRSISRKWSACF